MSRSLKMEQKYLNDFKDPSIYHDPINIKVISECENGNPKAQYLIALFIKEKNPNEFFRLLSIAEHNWNTYLSANDISTKVCVDHKFDYVSVKIMLATAYSLGIGTQVNLAKSASMFKELAESGNPDGQFYYAHCLLCGLGVNKNKVEGIKWLEKAGEQGQEKAMAEYVDMFYKDITHEIRNVEPTQAQRLIQQNKKDVENFTKSLKTNEKIHEVKKDTGGCYIATAVYGDYEAPEVKVLRNFRDYYLLNKFWGKKFVNIYYKYSPDMAIKLKNHVHLNRIIKFHLDIFIKILKNEYTRND